MPEEQILVVEDEYIVAKDIQDTLNNLGYQVPAIAASGEEALIKIDEHRPDLVLMDIVLKGKLDGIQTADRIRLNFDIPVIYLTAYADSETLQRARITEPYGYLIKPFQERELHSTIEMALYRQKMERRLKEREQWLSTTLNSIGEGVIATDEQGSITFINPTAEILLGWNYSEVLKKPFKEIFTIINESTGEEIEDPLFDVLKDGKNIEMSEDIIVFTKDKIEMPIEYVAAPIKDENDQIFGVVLAFQDITLRREAEQVLKESEERYRRLVDNFPEPMMVYSDYKLKYMNPETIRLFGATSAAELIGKSIIEFVHADYKDDLSSRIYEIEQGMEQQKSIKVKIIALDGYEKDVDISASHILYYGKPSVQIVMKDITVGRQAEEILRESEEKYRSLVERADDGICIVQDGLLKYVNPSIENMTGFDVDEHLGEPFTNFLHPDDKAKVINFYKLRMAGEKVPNIYEASILDKDGKKKVIEINAGLIHFDGKLADLVIIRDIGKRKEVENALRESEEKHRTLVKTSPDAIVYTDLKGNIQMVNKQTVKLYGCDSEEDLVGKNIFEFILPEDRKWAKENLQKALKESGLRNIHYELQKKDGTTYFGEINLSLISDSDNNPKGFISVIRDITQRKRADEILRESENQLREILNSLSDAIHVVNKDLTIRMMNDRFLEWIIELDLEGDIIGKNLFEVFPFLSDDVKTEYQKVFETGELMTTEERTDVGGRIFYTETRKIPIFESGEVKQVITVVRDISDKYSE